MPVNLSQHRGTIGKFNNRYLIRFRSRYQHFKYYLNDIDIAYCFCTLATISIFFVSLSFGIVVGNTIKIFLFSGFRKIKGVFISIFVFTILVSFVHESYFKMKY